MAQAQARIACSEFESNFEAMVVTASAASQYSLLHVAPCSAAQPTSLIPMSAEMQLNDGSLAVVVDSGNRQCCEAGTIHYHDQCVRCESGVGHCPQGALLQRPPLLSQDHQQAGGDSALLSNQP